MLALSCSHISYPYRYSCKNGKKLSKMDEEDALFDNVVRTCQAGCNWSDTIEDYKCLGK